MIELYKSEEDEDLRMELQNQITALEEKFRPLKLKTLLDGKFDRNNLYLSIHSGAGGTEASDWASMLMRMYTRWTERHGFKCEVLDMEENEGSNLEDGKRKMTREELEKGIADLDERLKNLDSIMKNKKN